MVTLTIISSAAISSVFSEQFSILRTFSGRPCSLLTIALNSRGIDTVSPCTPHPSTGVLSHRTTAARFRHQASPSIEEGFATPTFSQAPHPCLCKTAHLCLFLTKPLAHFRERFESRAPSGPARQKRPVSSRRP